MCENKILRIYKKDINEFFIKNHNIDIDFIINRNIRETKREELVKQIESNTESMKYVEPLKIR